MGMRPQFILVQPGLYNSSVYQAEISHDVIPGREKPVAAPAKIASFIHREYLKTP
jgi:hypothetical protein